MVSHIRGRYDCTILLQYKNARIVELYVNTAKEKERKYCFIFRLWLHI